MNDIRNPPLSERFASIITMMLGMIRAQGLRSLLHLPTLWLAMREIRRFGEALGALIAAFEAGTLPPPPPAPDQSWPMQQSPRPAAKPCPAVRARAPARGPRPRRASAAIARIPRRSPRLPAVTQPPRAFFARHFDVATKDLQKNPRGALFARTSYSLLSRNVQRAACEFPPSRE